MISRRARVLLLQMRDAAQDARLFVENFTFADFANDPKTQNAVAMALIRIGTNATRIAAEESEAMIQVPDIEWPLLRAMRNRIAHDYERLDMQVIWQTVQNDIPSLISQLKAALADGE